MKCVFIQTKIWKCRSSCLHKGACYDHRNSLSSNFASSLLDLISDLGWRTSQLCRILPLCHIPQCSTSMSHCQGAAHSPAAAGLLSYSSCLRPVPQGSCWIPAGRDFVNLQLFNGKIEACQKEKSSFPSTCTNPVLSVSVAVSGTGLFFPLS